LFRELSDSGNFSRATALASGYLSHIWLIEDIVLVMSWQERIARDPKVLSASQW
jgi:hypothetical protein